MVANVNSVKIMDSKTRNELMRYRNWEIFNFWRNKFKTI